MKESPVIVIAGSRALPHGQAPRLLIRFLAGLPQGSTILLRRGLFSSPNLFEAQVERLVDLIGLTLEWRQPVPVKRQLVAAGGRGAVLEEADVLGREATFDRDMAMCADADLVLAFFAAKQIGNMESGTVALVEKAVSLDTPTYAYAIQPAQNGELPKVLRVGEVDPKNEWSGMVPRAD